MRKRRWGLVVDLRGSVISRLVSTKRRAMHRKAPGEPVHKVIGINGVDGVHRLIEATAFPLVGVGGRILGAVALFWEIERR